MKLTKNQLKTWNSQQSDVDMFSKLENSFLQKFFRLNLIDYFDEFVINIYQKQAPTRPITKNQKAMLNYLFRVEKNFVVNQLEQKIHSFYKHRSKSFQSGQLQHVFKIRYCNWQPVPNMFKKGELIFMDIKIKAQIQRLQIIPKKLIQTLENFCAVHKNNQDQLVKQLFKNYPGEYMNIFVVYFGDINFHIVNKQNYEHQTISLFNKKVKLRIFTFFVSKQALLQTFRSMNKISTLDHINDLAIQYYELRRQKRKQKQLASAKSKSNKQKDNFSGADSSLIEYLQKLPDYMKLFLGGFGVVVLCLVTYKCKGLWQNGLKVQETIKAVEKV